MNQRHTHRVILAAAFILVLSAGKGITAQQQPAQQPPQQPQPQKPANSNEFPEDTNNVPVMPSNGINPAGNASNNSPTAPPPALPPPALPGDDADPVRSPDEPATNIPTGDSSSSSSLAGLGNVLNPSDDDTATNPNRRGRNGAPIPPEHTETAKEDIDVGSYYLSTKNWHAALSRYQSALILDPENPEVYWGLAEAQRNLKDYANAKANYQKLLDYDPDSKHAKDARKALKDPDVANAAPAHQ
jgi:Tetratricopeptide repeat